MTNADKDLIRPLDGLYVGMLSSDELASLDECIQAGYAIKDYSSPAGIIGLAKVKILNLQHPPSGD